MAPARNRLLDIGCGVGHYLELAQRYFKDVQGVEPSEVGAKAARECGFNVIQDYFHEGLQLEDKLDVITIIEVLEHLERPVELIRLAARQLNDNGILLVEVPNGQRILQQRLFYNLCTDHMQYFSVSSLAAMASQAGLTVLCVQESADPNLLKLYARKTPAPSATLAGTRMIALERMLAEVRPYGRLAAWGAGAESISFLAMLEGKLHLQGIFDSDAAKHGRRIGGYPILKPDKERVNACDAIILFANAHRYQIQEQLNQLGFTGQLLTFQL